MKRLDFNKYLQLKESLTEYIEENKLWRLSNYTLYHKTNIFQDYEDIKFFRKHEVVDDQLLDRLIYSKLGKEILCTNLVGDKAIISDRKKFTKFMRQNNEKLIKQGKVYRLFKSRPSM